jgi:hypothetical protein
MPGCPAGKTPADERRGGGAVVVTQYKFACILFDMPQMLGKLPIPIILKRFPLAPDNADVQVPKPFFNVGIRSLRKKDRFIRFAEFFLAQKSVIQELTHRPANVFSPSIP